MLYSFLRPLLFRLDPERAHDLTLAWLAQLGRLQGFNPLGQPHTGSPKQVMGLSFPNPVGLAAGLDKNGACLDGLSALGFGFIEIGTVTPKAQPGNPKPRLFRLPEVHAIINRMGFNNEGVDQLLDHVTHSSYRGILGINIGKNKDTPVEEALSDYQTCLQKVYLQASYVTVNISSPNTPGLRALQSAGYLGDLLKGLMMLRNELAITHQKKVPLALKIAPDLEPSELEMIADTLLRYEVDGIIATNTTSAREGVSHVLHGQEAGGLSGAPVRARSTGVVAQLARLLDGRIPIIACGGIMGLEDAREKMDAGASLVQIYTGLIYQGPDLVTALRKGL